MSDIFNRALKIAMRTGDKVIVIDPSQAKPYIMIGLDDYERLISRNDDSTVFNPMESVGRAGVLPRKSVAEPRVVSALAGSDPLEPDMVAPATAELREAMFSQEAGEIGAIKISEPAMEVEEHFFLEPAE